MSILIRLYPCRLSAYGSVASPAEPQLFHPFRNVANSEHFANAWMQIRAKQKAWVKLDFGAGLGCWADDWRKYMKGTTWNIIVGNNKAGKTGSGKAKALPEKYKYARLAEVKEGSYIGGLFASAMKRAYPEVDHVEAVHPWLIRAGSEPTEYHCDLNCEAEPGSCTFVAAFNGPREIEVVTSMSGHVETIHLDSGQCVLLSQGEDLDIIEDQ